MRLFVYGTLKRGHGRHRLLTGQSFLGTARTRPFYRMYNVGEFPGMVRSADGLSIEGELWDVDERCLADLDREEGFGVLLYLRETVELAPPHEAETAIAYLYNRGVAGLPDCGTRW